MQPPLSPIAAPGAGLLSAGSCPHALQEDVETASRTACMRPWVQAVESARRLNIMSHLELMQRLRLLLERQPRLRRHPLEPGLLPQAGVEPGVEGMSTPPEVGG